MDQIENAGRKGYCMLYFFITVVLVVMTLVYIYNQNFSLKF